MRTLIFSTVAPYLTSLMVVFSIFVLLRGHNEPGGGFIGGLIAASAFAIYGIACGVSPVRRALYFHPMNGYPHSNLAGAAEQTAAVVRFDGDGRLVDASGDFCDLAGVVSGSATRVEILSEYLLRFETINNADLPEAPDSLTSMIDRWTEPAGTPLEGKTRHALPG